MNPHWQFKPTPCPNLHILPQPSSPESLKPHFTLPLQAIFHTGIQPFSTSSSYPNTPHQTPYPSLFYPKCHSHHSHLKSAPTFYRVPLLFPFYPEYPYPMICTLFPVPLQTNPHPIPTLPTFPTTLSLLHPTPTSHHLIPVHLTNLHPTLCIPTYYTMTSALPNLPY